MKYTKKALEEQTTYNLNDNADYARALADEISACERRKVRYGYLAAHTPDVRNMIKALRMMPWQNTAQDWARLHVTEAALRTK
jgi:hypothetical protein